MFKWIVVALFAFVVFSLFQGMFYLVRDDGKKDQTRVVKMLTVRVSLSLLLFMVLIVGHWLGWIDPNA